MKLGDELTRIRRFLRDPDKKIWDDALLINLYNDTQQDLQQQTGILEGVDSIRVPPLYQQSYLQDWEWQYLTGSRFYQALRHYQQSQFVFCHYWEVQTVGGLGGDADDVGTHFTQPWEAWFTTPGMAIQYKFPENFHTMKFFAYDEEPIPYLDKRLVMRDQSWVINTGQPVGYFREDDLNNAFTLYPRPTVASWVQGDSMVLFGADETVVAETGTIIQRTGAILSQDTGLAVDIVEAIDNIIMVYDVIPTALVTVLDESDYPVYMRKYIHYGVLQRAYGANNDGRIQSLSDYWGYRFTVGKRLLDTMKAKKRQDRDYRLRTGSIPARRTARHPRLPSEYPPI